MRIYMDLHQKGVNPHAKIHYFCLMGKKCSLKMRKNTEFMLLKFPTPNKEGGK